MPLVSEAIAKPVLDREGFQQLLAAAYVLQQHHERVSRKDPRLQSTPASEIRELRSLAGRRDVDLRSSAMLIAERLRTVTGAEGVSISIVEDGTLESIACAGLSTRVPGGAVSANCLAASERLRTGKLFHSTDAERDVRLDLALCRETGVRSLLAVPIQGRDGVSGLIELRSSRINAFREVEEASCWWMAGLVREMREQDSHPSASPAEPSPLDAQHFFRQIQKDHGQEPEKGPIEGVRPGTLQNAAGECPVCGHPFREDEAYCGNCSLPRVAAVPEKNLQSKWASMWFRRRAQETLKERARAQDSLPLQPFSAAAPPARQPSFFHRSPPPEVSEASSPEEPRSEQISEKLQAAIRSAKFDYLRRAFAAVRRALKQAYQNVASDRRMRRLLLAAALMALLLTLFFWRSSPEQLGSGFTWIESLLAQIGTESPSRTPIYSGSPDVRVWVDAHTALYYCPGSSLYGKTPGGHFTTQHAAQRDEYEPATRIPCW